MGAQLTLRADHGKTVPAYQPELVGLPGRASVRDMRAARRLPFLPWLALHVGACGATAVDEGRSHDSSPSPDDTASMAAPSNPNPASTSAVVPTPSDTAIQAMSAQPTPTEVEVVMSPLPTGAMLLSATDVVRSVAALLDVELQFDPRQPEFRLNGLGTEWARQFYDGTVAPGSGETQVRGRSELVDALLVQVTDEQLTSATGCRSPCSVDTLDAFVRHAWRLPVELSAWEEVQGNLEPVLEDASALRAAVRAILVNTSFHTLSLQGTPSADERRLDDFEIASLLAFELTGTLPDEELLQSAEGGELRSSRGRSGVAERLWRSPAARDYIKSWLLRHFQLHQSRPQQQQPSLEAMQEETDRLIEHVVFEASLPLTELLTVDYSFLNPELAEWYGVAHSGSGWERVSLANTNRRGLLHHANWLTMTGTEVGPYYIRRSVYPLRLLCIELPQEVPFDFERVEVTDDMTPREQLLAQTMQQPCWNCHQGIDPIGFAFDAFDEQARRRETYPNGVPVDTSGEVDAEWIQVQFDDSVELVSKLAADPRYRDCQAQSWIGSALGLGPNDPLVQGELTSALGEDLHSIVLNRITSDRYVRRAAP